jgi:hypothetical protein
MQDTSLLRRCAAGAGLAVATVLAGCATQAPAPQAAAPAEPQAPACQAAAAQDGIVGNWLSVRREKGVRGELRTLFTLNADGTMAYTEQLKRGKQPSQGLDETGCWSRKDNGLVLRTLESNGAQVALDDPIYTNTYTVVSSSPEKLTLKAPDGAVLNARRMSPGYRLPF